MKTQEEIEQLAEKYADGYSMEEAHASYIAFQDGYTQCQEDNANKVFTLDDVKKIINLAYVSGGGGDTYQECNDFISEQMDITLNKQD